MKKEQERTPDDIRYKLPRKFLPANWHLEPRACGAKGYYVTCSYYHTCCVKHDIAYDNTILHSEHPKDFARRLRLADGSFKRCMTKQALLAPWYLRPWLKVKRIAFGLAVDLWRELSIRKVKRAGSVYEVYYKLK